MKLLLFLTPFILLAQSDPAMDAYQAWDAQHHESDYKARAQSLFEASAEWVAKWPDSKLAWDRRRDSLVGTQNHSPELWKQVDENLIRLHPPHTFAASAAYDWVANKINVLEGEELIASEIQWIDSQSRPTLPAHPSLTDVIEDAYFGSKLFGPLCTLANAQIQRKEFDGAHRTIARIRAWLDEDFKFHFDRDPLATFPDYEARNFVLSAQLAQAEGKNLDALVYFQKVITNPYFRTQYGGWVKETHALWTQLGGSEEGWPAFSTAPPLPAGVPHGERGMPFLPWVSLDYKLPKLNLPGLVSRTWTTSDFEGKTTMVYLFASWCGPCWRHLPAIQAIHERTKDRQDFQVVALSVDEDQEKLSAFMKEKNYSFPVLVGKEYVEQILPQRSLGQTWIVDRSGSVRLWRSTAVGNTQMEADESMYRLLQVSKR